MAYQRQSPDYKSIVSDIARRFPEEWERARERPDGSRDDAFIRRLAWELHKTDVKIGLNGKRGTDTISTDALAYKNPSAPGGAEVIDVITGAGHEPVWNDVTIPPGPEFPDGVLGKYIEPTDPGDPHAPLPDPSPNELKAIWEAINRNKERSEQAEKTSKAALTAVSEMVDQCDQNTDAVQAAVVDVTNLARRVRDARIVGRTESRGWGPAAHSHGPGDLKIELGK